MRKFKFFWLFFIMFNFVGISQIAWAVDDSGSDQEGVQMVVEANNQFALEMFAQVSEQDSGNVFFSPYSVSTALAMTYEGARGETADQIRSVFHYPEDDMTRRYNFARIYNLLNQPDQKYQLNTANALWAQGDYQFADEYFKVIDQYYGGKVTNMNFAAQPEPCRQTINSWVEDQTNDKIKDLIQSGQITPLTTLILTNAIYFKGTWKYQFDPEQTQEMDFRISPDEQVKVDMMFFDKNEENQFNYAQTDQFQILELPYDGENLSMLILLPIIGTETKNFNCQEINLDLQQIEEFKQLLTPQPVTIYLPKFKIETRYLLNDCLTSLGMPLAFERRADFSGMTGYQDLIISLVIHQAFVEVNEEGTEAAAATAVLMERTTTAIPSNVFKADHPFLFFIQDNRTGMILFMGRITNPSEG